MKNRWRQRWRIGGGLATVCLAVGLLFGSLGAVGWMDPRPVQAQPEPGDDGSSDDDKSSKEERREKIIERIQIMRSWKLDEILELDDATLKKVDETLRTYDDKIFKAHRELVRTTRELRRALRSGGASDAELQKLTDAIKERHKTLDRLRWEQFEAAGKHLDAKQRARLLLFMPEFERKVRRAIHRARRKEMLRRRRGPKRGPGPPWGPGRHRGRGGPDKAPDNP